MTWVQTDNEHRRKWVGDEDVEPTIHATDNGGHIHLFNVAPGVREEDTEWWHPCDTEGVRELRDALTALLDIIEEDPVVCHTRFKGGGR